MGKDLCVREECSFAQSQKVSDSAVEVTVSGDLIVHLELEDHDHLLLVCC